MTGRELSIIKILLNTQEPVSSIALSQEIGCSKKTVQSEIKEINKSLKKAKIISIRGVGYKLEGDIDELNLNNGDYDDIDRVGYIIKSMIKISSTDKNTIKLEDLAETMYVSVSTLKNDLKEVKSILEHYNINIVSKHKQGIGIEASEEDIIKGIIDLCNKKDINLSLNEFLDDSVKDNIFSIKKIILDNLNNLGLVLTDIEFKNLLNYILIYLNRNSYNKEEFIKTYILNYKNKRSKIIIDEKYKYKIINSIKVFCQNLKLATSIDISNDNIFEEYLYNHISNLIKKDQLGIKSYYLNTTEIKIKYPFAFELAKIAKKTIEKDLNIEISEDEIANIALHVGGALERASHNESKKIFKTIIVCTSGIGTSMLIKAKLESIFKDKLEILKVMPSYLVEYINVLDVDFVISTVPIDIEKVPVINISPLLSSTEIKIIEKYMETENIYEDLNLKNLFSSDIFFTELDFNKKEDVIEFMADKLIENKYIDLEMKQSYIEREKIATTEIGNMVAIPHGASGTIYKNKIAVGILKHPIDWEISKVRLVIMLAIDKDRILDYEELFSNIYKRVDSITKVVSICETKNFEKFTNMFK